MCVISTSLPDSLATYCAAHVLPPLLTHTAGYEATLDVLGLSGLQKVTARLIEGVEIQQTPTQFTVSFVTVVPFFRVSEAVALDGGSSQLGRRDLRFGRQTAAARSVPGGVLVEMSWGLPMAGRVGGSGGEGGRCELAVVAFAGCFAVTSQLRSLQALWNEGCNPQRSDCAPLPFFCACAGELTEKYTFLEDGCLCVEAKTRVGNQSATSTTVYRRSSGSRDEMLNASKQKNPSVAAVLQQQKQQGLDV